MICLPQGSARVRLDEFEYRLLDQGVICIPAGVVHGFAFAPETEGAVLTLKDSILLGEAGARLAEFERLFEAPRIVVFETDSVVFEQLGRNLALLHGEFERHDAGQQVMLEWLARAALMTIYRQWEQGDYADLADG